MNITPHFSLEELIASETAARRGIDNSVPDRLLDNLKALAGGLETIRALLGHAPIIVSSGYRCPALNKLVGGATNSWHLRCLAADILCPSYGIPLEVCKKVVSSEIPFEQIIHEYGSWCHVAFAEPGKTASRQVLTISSVSTGYRNGLL